MEQSKFYKIKNISEQEYTLVGCDDSVIIRPIQDVDKSASAFTIKDAKDGDVLVASDKSLFIYDGSINENGSAGFHIAFTEDMNILLNSDDGCGWEEKDSCHPATKEQRELLFQKMKEAGYTFDFEKKELKKVEQKYWNEEDERMFDYALDMIEWYNGKNEDKSRLVSSWLKSLKDRVQPQPKQEWGEEDEYFLAFIVELLYGIEDNTDKDYESRCRRAAAWLKSLRPQTQWKPSEGQLECLGYAIEKAEKDWSPLANNRIYLTLKALKEQLEKL